MCAKGLQDAFLCSHNFVQTSKACLQRVAAALFSVHVIVFSEANHERKKSLRCIFMFLLAGVAGQTTISEVGVECFGSGNCAGFIHWVLV